MIPRCCEKLYLLSAAATMMTTSAFFVQSPKSDTLMTLKSFGINLQLPTLFNRRRHSIDHLFTSNIIDAEFSSEKEDGSRSEIKNLNLEKSTLLEASFEIKPEWKDITLEFVDPGKNKYIDCNMAYVVEMEGINYAIGTPCETQVAIFCEGSNTDSIKETFFIDPDDDRNIELMEMAAAELTMSCGKTPILFKRTPRTLTVEGDLEPVRRSWRDVSEKKGALLGDLLNKEINNDEDDDEFLDEFFKSELGESYMDNISMDEDGIDVNEQAKEFADFFNLPGLGTEIDDDEGVAKMINEIFAGGDTKASMSDEQNEDDNSVIRLVSFLGSDKKMYSLVQLIQPMVLVGKEDPSLELNQRMLLTPKESDAIVPILEDRLKKELEDAGLTIKP